MSNHRRDLKRRAVEHMGGVCQSCGYDRCLAALEFHHLYGKDFQIAKRIRAWNEVVSELAKCRLLCANCHREAHHGG